jgi:hypothetical protein
MNLPNPKNQTKAKPVEEEDLHPSFLHHFLEIRSLVNLNISHVFIQHQHQGEWEEYARKRTPSLAVNYFTQEKK